MDIRKVKGKRKNEWTKKKRKEVINIKKYGRRKEEIINKENEYKGTKVVQANR